MATELERLESIKRFADLEGLFSDDSKHHRYSIAADAAGMRVGATNPRAVSWCLWGGAYKCGLIEDEILSIRASINEMVGHDSIPTFSDSMNTDAADLRKVIRNACIMHNGPQPEYTLPMPMWLRITLTIVITIACLAASFYILFG